MGFRLVDFVMLPAKTLRQRSVNIASESLFVCLSVLERPKIAREATLSQGMSYLGNANRSPFFLPQKLQSALGSVVVFFRNSF